MSRARVLSFLVALVVLCLPVVAFAQASTAAVSGRVSDQTGGALPGASVTLVSKGAGGAPRSTTTDSNGNFRLDGLAKGAYEVSASLSGFNPRSQPVTLSEGEDHKLEITLSTGGLREEVVVTATRTPQEIAAIPGSVTVLGQRAILEQTLPTAGLGDTLGKLVPGLAAPNASNSQFGQTLRGRTLSVLIDGVPQSTTRNVQRDLETIDPSAIERVEVLRGPTAIYGDGATGGVINIITRVPGTGPAQFTTDFDISTSLTHPEDSFSGRIWQSAAGRKGTFYFTLNGSYEQVGSFFDAEGDRIPPDPNNQGGLSDSGNLGLFGKFGVGSQKQRLQLTAIYANRDQDTDYTTDPTVNSQPGHQKARALPGLQMDEPQGADNLIVSLDYRHEPVLSTEAHVQVYYRDYSTSFFPRDFRTNAARGNIIYQSFIESTKAGGRLELTTSFSGSRRPVILWGLDLADEDTEQPVWVMDPAAYDASRGVVFRITGRRSWTPPMNQKNIAGFAHIEWKPLERLTLRAGLRHESIKVDVADFTVLQGFAIPGGKLDYKATPFNAGFVVGATKEFNFFFNFSQGFSIADIGLVLRAAPRTFDFERLKPEAQNVDNYEVGLRFNKKSVAATLSGFYNTSDFGVTFAPDLTMVRSPEKIYGIEATFDVTSGENLHLGMTGTWLEGKFDANRDGVYAYLANDRIAPPKLTGYIDHQTTRRWRNRVQGLYNGTRDRFGAAGQPDAIGRIGFGLAEVESYFLVDLFSYLNVGKGTLRFAVQNLLNKMYFPPVSQWSGTDATYTAAQGAVFSVGYTIRY
jgi:iron complex outermembrane receptor protein